MSSHETRDAVPQKTETIREERIDRKMFQMKVARKVIYNFHRFDRGREPPQWVRSKRYLQLAFPTIGYTRQNGGESGLHSFGSLSRLRRCEHRGSKVVHHAGKASWRITSKGSSC